MSDYSWKKYNSIWRWDRNNGRDKQNNPNAGPGQDNLKDKGVVSDDDKIRLQLFVDVKHYIKTMESLGVDPGNIKDENNQEPIIEQLDQLVIEATKSCYDDYLERLQMK